MGEVVNVLVAFAVIVFLFRWVTSSSDSPGDRSATDALGFRPKNVTQDMVDTIHGMFPDIPTDNIRFDLLRTGNVQLTSNKILERGFLDPPPAAFYTLYPRSNQNAHAAPPVARPTPNTESTVSQANLISRYNLQSRLPKTSPPISDDQIGGKAVWEDSPEKREASLKERKAQMILAARQRFLAQQQAGMEDSSKKS